ncbi:hypothetical protein AVEN_117188-1 [Araneus ventricosus]|uniref:Uncharacterized protein n=1 Tax=Araneus ventricosus TaxID=182803 RepID=A0A4Y2AY07_ARAVE|nr:hypothetical protein AVEN_117188-1 [Araneus ventricosus]
MAGRTDDLAKCELRSVIQFLQAEGWFVENDQCSCLLSDFATTAKKKRTPDLATSDFHIFPELKNLLERRSFQNNEELQSNIKAHLTSLAATFLLSRIRSIQTESIVIIKKFELEILTNLHVLDLPESEKHNFGIMSVCLGVCVCL